MSPYPFFSTAELACPCCHQADMDHEFMLKVVELRKNLDFPFVVSSAYRCPDHNRKVGGAEGSAHTTGNALDIAVSGERALRIVEAARRYGITGIGINQKGGGRFIHIDDLPGDSLKPRPHIWSY